MAIGITILGSTGSIGCSTLDVISRSSARFRVVALTARQNVVVLAEQCVRFHPQFAVVSTATAAEILQPLLKKAGLTTEILVGEQALVQVASHPDADYVMAAIVGGAGLLPTLAAARAGKRILLANKEALVMSGALFMQEIHQHGATLLPIDSEHNAIYQCMPSNFRSGTRSPGVKRILLTASGGPFRHTPLEQLSQMTPDQACAHPNWAMGRKISVDSATMMNKALEVIEAHWLFNMALEDIQVLLHPQSIIHSMVEYEDGSVLAQLGNPDMRTPIAHALAWPERIQSGVNSLDLLAAGRLDFAPMPDDRYPALQLAYAAMKVGGTATTILNAANEVAVQAFLAQRIAFTDIAKINETILEDLPSQPANDIAAILAADAKTRLATEELIQCRA